ARWGRCRYGAARCPGRRRRRWRTGTSPGKTHSSPRRRRARADGTFGKVLGENGGGRVERRGPPRQWEPCPGSPDPVGTNVPAGQLAPPPPDCRSQATIASARLRTPSFRYRLETWLRTVFSATPSSYAI